MIQTRTNETKFLAFDIETAKKASNDPAASYNLGVTCAAICVIGSAPETWYGELGKPMTPSEVQDFAIELCAYAADGYSLAGINSTGFDFRVLAESAQDLVTYQNMQDLALNSYDPPLQLFCERGFIKGMDAIAKGFRLVEQKGDMGGLEAIEAWNDGRASQVLEYVAQDALVTLKIVEACKEKRGIFWEKNGRIISHGWKKGRLLTVREMLELPLPSVDWMKSRGMVPWERSKFAGWLND